MQEPKTKSHGWMHIRNWPKPGTCTPHARQTGCVPMRGRGRQVARGHLSRQSIAKPGHTKAKTNFPVAEYRAEWAEWAELEALGV